MAISRREKINTTLGAGGVLFAIASIAGYGAAEPYRRIILALWILLPPAWFWFEFVFLVTEEEKTDSKKLAKIKYVQGLASKIWIAVSTVLAALYFGKDLLAKVAG
jgi:hypothetical protein